ncbi:nitroreductase family protein [Halomonas sp. LC1]|uniref:nitroreductase family protein n=1 Tax=Halomonas sp. LC1 TaxID=3043733 RepID=UPI0025579AD7|nr:nitroreductase family protein [Halomonas sp. LC1]MDK9688099.1 nitroreductase family protein [Halomonas sp. LC1]
MLLYPFKIVTKIVSEIFLSASEWLAAVKSFNLHLKYSFSQRNPEKDIDKLKYYIVKNCHIVEKGMSLPEPRYAFGQSKISKLIIKTKKYGLAMEKEGEIIVEMVRDALRQYRNFHHGKEDLFEPGFIENLDEFLLCTDPKDKGGVSLVKKNQWNNFSIHDYEEFISSRRSVRDFDKTPVSDDVIISAIKVGLKAPSVCNRQGWHVHYYSDKNKIEDLLSHQNGNSGFTKSIDKLIIVTGNIKAFTRNEHNQLFVDGGIVSMNIILAIHAAGLGSCPLNTCMPYYKQKKIMNAGSIPVNERLIMMIAVGSLKKEFLVPKSEKYSIKQTLIKH